MPESTPHKYAEADSPKLATAFDEANKAAARLIKPKAILYTTALLSWMQPFQSGWSTSQMNLSQYNDTDECNARPVAEGTCLMFPGHTKLQWTFAVNAWIFGAMVGSLCCGQVSDRLGRKKTLMANCIFMIIGGVVQTVSSDIWLFALGRFAAGIASGTATATIGGYMNELTPPHMRNTLGLGLQIFTTIGILVPAICFFFLNTSTGWRYLAAFPVVLAGAYLLLAPTLCIESPAWLLTQGRKQEAKEVIARLYGEEHVQLALTWLEVGTKPEHAEEGLSASRKESMFAPRYRMQLLTGLLLSCSQQLSGINAVFYYSGSIFSDAGISDSRVGTLVIDFINIWPAFFTGVLANRFGARNMILWGLAGMVIMSVGMTLAFVVDVSALSIVFTALYVIVFGVTLGPLVWVMTADIFPDSIRASASSFCIGINWLCNLVVGISYPYVSEALGDYAYAPFVVLLATFFLLGLKMVPETSGKSAEEIQAEYDSRREK
ncbi:major facilitator superfamily [Plasmopara halstedii]|uniref:Hexose transporter 1 n=1 Tax=Plasmopara halstedii TaxID=4781 RepID=A0A0P1ABM9_PLAHL|nr:major facilitator superfamily [Plasmopara halstedii]CEG37748.1 major facilitator superfamily [Plasmopara halstedii]|eukprot:XP_024574117.1 major facilitator superfamily [Plasmopara halstedii]